MPAIKYYTVEQTRTVKISAENELEAASIATSVFEDVASSTEEGSVRKRVEVTDLIIRKDL